MLTLTMPEIHSPAQFWAPVLPFAQDSPPRPQTAKLAHRQAQQPQACRFRSGKGVWDTHEDVYPRGKRRMPVCVSFFIHGGSLGCHTLVPRP